MSVNRDKIVQVAKTWIGTPYHHQSSVKQVGTDCLGLIRGVYREIYGGEPENPPPYSKDWAEATGEETMIEAARRHLIEIETDSLLAGDVVIFRFRRKFVAKHAAILTGSKTMVHAVEGARVSEVHLNSWWHRHMAAAFCFPGVN